MVYEIRSFIGTRSIQEDAAGGCVTDDGLFVVVCDGIGSKVQGGESSRMTVERLLDLYKNGFDGSFQQFITKSIDAIDTEVNEKYGKGCGTTVVAVHIKDNELNWLSVGDSRLYILRDGRMKQITKDHNYRLVLDKRRELNIIDEDTYQSELKKADHLVSFIGMGGIDLVDVSMKPLALNKGDKLLVTTDGLYKSLTEKVVYDTIATGKNLCVIADELMSAVKQCKGSIDNTTFALVADI